MILNAVKIWGQVLLACVTYGILHDQITARLCPEYFTYGHPDLGVPWLYHSSNPTILGFAWGITATWWMSFLLAPVVIPAALFGSLPKLTSRQLWQPIAVVMGFMFLMAAMAGWCGWSTYSRSISSVLPPSVERWFVVAAWSHGASYLGGAVGALGLSMALYHQRRTLA